MSCFCSPSIPKSGGIFAIMKVSKEKERERGREVTREGGKKRERNGEWSHSKRSPKRVMSDSHSCPGRRTELPGRGHDRVKCGGSQVSAADFPQFGQ